VGSHCEMPIYVAAQIGRYPLVEPDLSDFESVALLPFRLEGRHYVAHTTVPFGAALTLDGPFAARSTPTRSSTGNRVARPRMSITWPG
jgi:hypothetical protein